MSKHPLRETAHERTVRRRVTAQVFKRDQGICWLCGRPTDPTKPWPHPLAPTLDHVRPRSRGGATDESNCRCAHHYCNVLRGTGGRPWGRIRTRAGRLLSVASGVAEDNWTEEGIGKRALRQAVLIGLAYALRGTPRYAV